MNKKEEIHINKKVLKLLINKIMEKNIFEGAKFGDKFITRDGEIVIFSCINESSQHPVKIMRGDSIYLYQKNGMYYNTKTGVDIVSRYQERIDGNKLDELANEFAQKEVLIKGLSNLTKISYGYKAGYRKAMGI